MANTEVASAPPQREFRKAIADWFLEVSALLAVFPWLDQLVFHPAHEFDWKVTMPTLFIAFGMAATGLSLLVIGGRWQVLLITAGSMLSTFGFLLFLRR